MDSAKAKEYQRQAAEAAAAARAAAKEASAAAAEAAARAKEWAGPQVEHAREWLAPRARHLYSEGARKAEPYVRKAGDKAADWTDALHAAVVGAAIPAVLAAVDSAAHADEEPESRSVWPKIVVPAMVVGAAAAALVVWARRDPGRDPWAGDDDEWEFADGSDFKDQLRDNVNRAADAAGEAAKRAASAAAAAAAAAADALSEKAGPAVSKVKETAVAEARKVRDAAEVARHKAAAGLAETFDDAEDVWEDEAEDSAAAPKKAAPRKTAAKKPTTDK